MNECSGSIFLEGYRNDRIKQQLLFFQLPKMYNEVETFLLFSSSFGYFVWRSGGGDGGRRQRYLNERRRKFNEWRQNPGTLPANWYTKVWKIARIIKKFCRKKILKAFKDGNESQMGVSSMTTVLFVTFLVKRYLKIVGKTWKNNYGNSKLLLPTLLRVTIKRKMITYTITVTFALGQKGRYNHAKKLRHLKFYF